MIFMMSYPIFWLVAAVLFVIIEFATSIFISLWFIFGALAAIVAAIYDVSFTNQIYIFLGVSLLSLLLLRPFALKFAKPKAKSNVQAIIGSIGIVTEQINNLKGTGRIKVNYQDWGAQTENENEIIDVNKKVKVIDVRGIKAIVIQEEN